MENRFEFKKKVADTLGATPFTRALPADTPDARYAMAIAIGVQGLPKKLQPAAMVAWRSVLNHPKIPLLPTGCVKRLNQRFPYHPDLFQDLIQFAELMKSRPCPPAVWEVLIYSSGVDRASTAARKNRLIIASECLKLVHRIKPPVTDYHFLEAILKIKVPEGKALKLRDFSAQATTNLPLLLSRLQKMNERGTLPLDTIKILHVHFSEISDLPAGLSPWLELFECLDRYLPTGYLAHIEPHELNKLFELHRLNPTLFSKLSDFPHSELHALALFRHLFEGYNFPLAFFRRRYEINTLGMREMLWMNHLLSGKNLITADGFSFKVTRKVAHLFNHCEDMPFFDIEGILYYLALLDQTQDASFARTATLALDVHERTDPWLKILVQLFRRDFRTYLLRHAIDYVRWHLEEKDRMPMIRDHDYRSFTRKLNAWEEEQELNRRLRGPRISFPKKEFLEWSIEREDSTYRVRQILDSHELAREGASMGHCVATYRNRCAKGLCSIYSLQKRKGDDFVSVITMEHASNGLVQALGKGNRPPTAHELDIIQLWANEHQLPIHLYGFEN